ncbi:acyl-CoA dehydrogenase family protein [Pseudoduganella umbonata]|uniref:Acyl-CoA dehydrogenase n=1 Tax=Pseudoduganella umbonata TaxID=864828 RepID=A0A4P8HNI8_9BURK|nr:acyl-CoA dehydrogenase family protein [Pseudoduganella umbonata]MBB3219957.1 acyl-CoA dehydrogenase [Pseudoduganella umbonata]QCP09970.1 acyl-CoA dehydrogenase [Pseudoduganella umbonata]
MRQVFDSTVERLFADIASPAAVLACEDGAWPQAMWAAVEESGFPLALAPEALGGAGASWADVCGVMRLAGRFNVPLPLPETILANWLLGAAGLAPAGGPVSIVGGGSLRLQGSLVSGKAPDVPWGGTVPLVVAVTGGSAPMVVLLPTEAASQLDGANAAAEPRTTLLFEDVAPVAQAPLPAGWPADVLLLGGALVRAAQIAGALEGVLAMATGYAGERVQFGKPIGSFQAIQHQVAVLAEHAAAAVMACEAAFAAEDTRIVRLQAIAAKICASEAAGIGAGIAHAVHGAIGFTHEHSLHLSTRRLWSWRSEFGSASTWSQRLGRAVCAAGPEAFWPGITDGRFGTLQEQYA